ncbi:MAG: hypothetical protein WAR24_20135 [Candidatus Acidiferrales bacterium]
MDNAPSSPATEYSRRMEARHARALQLEKRHIQLGNLRLLIVIAAITIAWLALKRHAFSPAWLLVPAAVFLALVVVHDRVIRARTCAERAEAFYQRGLARIEDRWAGSGATGGRFSDPNHIYSADLDLFGRGGLFELLSIARTRMGEDRLAHWLLVPSPVHDIAERHAAITELREGLDLREDLAVLGADVGAAVKPDELAAWAEGRVLLHGGSIRILAAVLSLTSASALVYLLAGGPALPFLILLAVNGGLAFWDRRGVDEVVASVGNACEDLLLLSRILRRVERERFASARLRQLVKGLETADEPPSRSIKKLGRLTDMIHSRRNMIISALDIPLLYSLQLAFAVEVWRRKRGSSVRLWLDSAGEIEALLSLAAYSYEHPDDPFPEIVESSNKQALFDGEELGHPLLPAARCVRNSIRLEKEPQDASRERLKHVGQKHVPARRRDQHGSRHGRRSVSCQAPSSYAPGGGNEHSRDRLTSGRPIRFLRGNHPPAPGSGRDRRQNARAIPA